MPERMVPRNPRNMEPDVIKYSQDNDFKKLIKPETGSQCTEKNNPPGHKQYTYKEYQGNQRSNDEFLHSDLESTWTTDPIDDRIEYHINNNRNDRIKECWCGKY